MGFFSWKDCVDGESIPATLDGVHPLENKKVTLLSPDGKNISGIYTGYGSLNGVDFYTWLAVQNGASELGFVQPDEKRSLGLAIDVGRVFKDKNGGLHMFLGFSGNREKLLYEEVFNIEPFYGTFSDIEPTNNKTPNEMIASGEWVLIPFIDIFKDVVGRDKDIVDIKLTLFDNAKYEDFPASPSCEYQGFFYDEGYIEEAKTRINKHPLDYYAHPEVFLSNHQTKKNSDES